MQVVETRYAVDVDEDKFLKVLEKDLIVDPNLCDELSALPGVCRIEYDGHFGATVWFTVEADYDNPETHAEILRVITHHIDSK